MGGNSDQAVGQKRRLDDTEYLEQSREIVDGVKSAVTAGLIVLLHILKRHSNSSYSDAQEKEESQDHIIHRVQRRRGSKFFICFSEDDSRACVSATCCCSHCQRIRTFAGVCKLALLMPCMMLYFWILLEGGNMIS
jgi:hypothetical protein